MSTQSDFILDKFNGQTGYFVDVGASDGFNDSNTLDLEKNGWSGICIDGLERNYQSLLQTRSYYCVNAVIAGENRKAEFVCQGKSGSNGLGGSGLTEFMDKPHLDFIIHHLGGRLTTVKTRTLESVLREYFAPLTIDFLDVDVEGAAWEILRNFPFTKWRFSYINVEVSAELTPPLTSLLNRYGYVECGRFGQDVMFKYNKVSTTKKRIKWNMFFGKYIIK